MRKWWDGGANMDPFEEARNIATARLTILRNVTLGEHEWVPADDVIKWPYCRKCLVIKQRHGKHKPCKGPAKLGLRKASND